MPKIRDYPAVVANFTRDLARGDFRAIWNRLFGYFLYKLHKNLKDDSPIRYSLWKYYHSRRRCESDSSAQVRFAIIYFFDGKLDRSAYHKITKRLQNQNYKNYSLLVAGPDSNIDQLIHELDRGQGVEQATEHVFICFIEQGDMIARHALSSVAKAFQDDSSRELFYSDEDVINKYGIRVNPYFKPQYAPLMLMSHNYLNAFLCIRLTDQVMQGIRTIGKINQASLYRLVLKLTRGRIRISRIADVLYHRHWQNAIRLETVSTRHIVQDEIMARSLKARVLSYDPAGFTVLKFYPEGNPRVSIIIPFKDKIPLLATCIQSIEAKSTYRNYEIILIDNRSIEKATLDYLRNTRHRIITADIDFNYAKLNNMGVQATEGEYIILLNNDTEIITPDWIESMLGLAQLPEVGAVGAKLLFPDNTIQHAGVVMGCRHINRFLGAYEGGYKHYNNLIREYGCVTGACLMISKNKYLEVGGLTESLAVEGNDVDFCFKLARAGYYNVYNPHCVLYHYESVSRKGKFQAAVQKERIYMQQNWKEFMVNDRFYNPNFAPNRRDYCIRID
ncbi:MAG: glycosyltransferase family 2 protein [bacterium]